MMRHPWTSRGMGFAAVGIWTCCWILAAPVMLPSPLAPVMAALADDNGDDGDGAAGGGGRPAGVGRAGRPGSDTRGGFGTPGGDGGRLMRALRGFGFRTAAPARRTVRIRRAPPPVVLRRPPPRPEPPRALTRPPPPARSAPEIVVAGLDAGLIAVLEREGFSIVVQADLALLPGTTARLRVPRGTSAGAALERIRTLSPDLIADRNHLFFQRFLPAAERRSPAPALRDALDLVAWPRQQRSCVPTGAVGLIDTALDATHPALTGRIASAERLVDAGRTPSSPEHGTAVAVLITGAAAPTEGATAVVIHAVDAFHRREGTDAADAFDLVRALDRLVGQNLRVINMSIAGPQNLLLDRAGATATARGVGIVAAVGNDGPRAEPRFPAAYPWAIAVTAVDRDRGIYVRAGRGEHIDVAAPGVGLLVEDGRGRERLRTGTSFAAPFVTAALALTLARKADRPLEDALRDLTAASMDLGEPGPDAIYGVGLLQVEPLCR